MATGSRICVLAIRHLGQSVTEGPIGHRGVAGTIEYRVASRIPKERWSYENSLTYTIRSTVLVVSDRLSVGSVDVHDESNNGK